MNTLPEHPNQFFFQTEIDRETAEYLALFDTALKLQEADALQRNRCNAASAAASRQREKSAFEAAIAQRMRDKGLFADADYVEHSFGLKTEDK